MFRSIKVKIAIRDLNKIAASMERTLSEKPLEGYYRIRKVSGTRLGRIYNYAIQKDAVKYGNALAKLADLFEDKAAIATVLIDELIDEAKAAGDDRKTTKYNLLAEELRRTISESKRTREDYDRLIYNMRNIKAYMDERYKNEGVINKVSF